MRGWVGLLIRECRPQVLSAIARGRHSTPMGGTHKCGPPNWPQTRAPTSHTTMELKAGPGRRALLQIEG